MLVFSATAVGGSSSCCKFTKNRPFSSYEDTWTASPNTTRRANKDRPIFSVTGPVDN